MNRSQSPALVLITQLVGLAAVYVLAVIFLLWTQVVHTLLLACAYAAIASLAVSCLWLCTPQDRDPERLGAMFEKTRTSLWSEQYSLTGSSAGRSGALSSKPFLSERAICAVREADVTKLQQYLKTSSVDGIDGKSGSTLLHMAALVKGASITRILLQAGASVDTINHDGDTPLHVAAAVGAAVIVKLLTDHGASPEIENRQGQDCLALAESFGNRGCALLMQRALQRDQQRDGGARNVRLRPSVGPIASPV